MNKEQYLREPNKCPFCGGTDLAAIKDHYFGERDSVNYPPKISTAMSCENCGKEWFDIYQLTDVKSMENILDRDEANYDE